MSSEKPHPQEEEQVYINQEIARVERSLLSLKERWAQIQQDREQYSQLRQRREQLESQATSQEIRAQLKLIEEELAVLEGSLSTSGFDFRTLVEPFWQAVRFGGLGVVLGWLLKSCAEN